MQSLIKRLQQYRAHKKWYRRYCYRSAVAIILRQGEQGLEALMIQRAERENDPWSGQMGFPGGRMEKYDGGGMATAQRETHEEIGLPSNAYSDCIGRLPDIIATPKKHLRPMVISCYVFMLEDEPDLQLNYEVASVVWLPLNYLANKNNRQAMQWQRGKQTVDLPCYLYQGKRVWGLSLKMLDELMRVAS
ncbi:CoA pyrophosphatase [Dasania marina]|tara:strand:+ start:26528 stop:27097 length:570 start_codon:yes stop_codon:yes gene_type:complete